MNTSCYAKVKFLRRLIKRTWWRMRNLSWKQFLGEFVLRQFTTITFDTLPHYTFAPLNPESFKEIAAPTPPEFFVMIKPSGLHKETEIKALIAQFHLEISREEDYHNFFEIAAHLFNITKIHDYCHQLPEGFLWLQLLELFYPATCQEMKVLYVKNGNEAILKRLKTRIRKKIGVEFFRVQVQGQSIVTCMTPVHTSDAATLEYELKILRYFQSACRPHPIDLRNTQASAFAVKTEH